MANKGLMDIIKAAKKMRLQYPKKYSKWTDYVKAASKQLKPVAKKSVGKVSELPFPKEKKQTGSSNKKYDIMHQAKPVGKRKATSAAKRPYYYEYRANRTDKGKLLGIPSESKVLDDILKDIKETQKRIEKIEIGILHHNLAIKNPANKQYHAQLKKQQAILKKVLRELLAHNKELKKHIQ